LENNYTFKINKGGCPSSAHRVAQSSKPEFFFCRGSKPELYLRTAEHNIWGATKWDTTKHEHANMYAVMFGRNQQIIKLAWMQPRMHQPHHYWMRSRSTCVEARNDHDAWSATIASKNSHLHWLIAGKNKMRVITHGTKYPSQ
jgi:hypothetical protein